MDSGPKIEGGTRLSGKIRSGSPDFPLVTVITVVFNGEAHLEETITRVVNQTYPNLEYVVIDGGSKDRSLEIIKKYEDKIDYWMSEKDRGISDAFNKGIKLSHGDYINFQGDGDGFFDEHSISNLFKEVGSERPPLIASRIERVDLEGKHLFFSPKIKKSRLIFLLRMGFPHQGLFTHKRVFEKFGLFDPTNKYSMDYEHLLRDFHGIKNAFVSDQVTSKWRADGLSMQRTRDVLSEYHYIKKKNKIAHPFILQAVYRWTLFKFHVKKLIRWDA